MLVPSIFNDNFVDNFFDDMFRFPGFTSGSRSVSNVMKTDIQDLGENYQLDIELPALPKKIFMRNFQADTLPLRHRSPLRTRKRMRTANISAENATAEAAAEVSISVIT